MYKDARGKRFPIQDYQRIVSLVPSWTESLFVIGAGNRVVAATDYCVEPAEALAVIPRVGGTKNPRVQDILDLFPDLVIANVEENVKSDISRLESSGVPVFVTDARTVDQAIDELHTLGGLLAVDNVDEFLAPIQRELATASDARAQADRPRVFVAIWKNPWMTVNGGTFVNDMLELSGGVNVFRDRARRYPLSADLGLQEQRGNPGERDTRYPRVSIDEIVEQAPDIILLPSEPYPFSQRDAEEWREQITVPAIRHDKVVLMDGKILSWYGTRMGESLKRLRELLHDNHTAAAR